MKNHLIKIHNQADISSLPILQETRSQSDQEQHIDDHLEEQLSVEIDLTPVNNP